ncbi:hypothetical protein HPP92_016527 [Vanilla planifolia]|uniref:RING-type E3 ubiquitin transferase n=2 Tax=Vanilla planifolia TaxID=51239 RepID=A0A835QEY3_VANPL|nr:hypothetical protein HPP92_016527 [Vanilla planifolia]
MESHLPRGLLAENGIHGGSGAPSPFQSPATERASAGIPFRPSIAIISVVLTTMLSLTCLLLLYAKHCRRQGAAARGGGSSGLVYGTSVERRSSGVGQAVVESLPVFRFGSLIGEKSGLECAVCLSRYETEELLRLLPKCRHAFHVDCVDAWLNFHSSCPICRSRVSPEDVLLLHRESAEPEAVPKPPGRRISGRHSSAGENSSGTGVRFAVRRPSESELQRLCRDLIWKGRGRTVERSEAFRSNVTSLGHDDHVERKVLGDLHWRWQTTELVAKERVRGNRGTVIWGGKDDAEMVVVYGKEDGAVDWWRPGKRWIALFLSDTREDTFLRNSEERVNGTHQSFTDGVQNQDAGRGSDFPPKFDHLGHQSDKASPFYGYPVESSLVSPLLHFFPYPTIVHTDQMGTDSEEIREHLLDMEAPISPPPPATTKMSVQGLWKSSDTTREPILRGVSLELPAAQVVGIIGPSGSGKSTLLRALNRLWEPAAGTILLDGADITRVDVLSLRRRVGMLFQLPVLFEGTVADNVRYGPQLRGKKLSDSEVQSLLSMADLEPSLASKPASNLSVGQAQRVALARTLANDPEVLLLDEPTSALDPISTQNIEEAIVRLKKTRGMTIVMVSHSVKQVQRIADVVCLLVGGEIVEVLPPSQLSQAQHPMARRFLELSD